MNPRVQPGISLNSAPVRTIALPAPGPSAPVRTVQPQQNIFQRFGGLINRDVIQPVVHSAPVQFVAPATENLYNMGKQGFQASQALNPFNIQNDAGAARAAMALATRNRQALQNAIAPQRQALSTFRQSIQGTGQQAVQLGISADPLLGLVSGNYTADVNKKTYTPQGSLQRALLGNQAIPSIQKQFHDTQAQNGTANAAGQAVFTALMDAALLKGGAESVKTIGAKGYAGIEAGADHQASQASGLKPENIVNNNEAGTLNDYAEHRMGNYRPEASTLNNLIRQARNAAQTAGIDITSGPPRDIHGRIADYLEARDTHLQARNATLQGGYARVPFLEPGEGKIDKVSQEYAAESTPQQVIKDHADYLQQLDKGQRGGVINQASGTKSSEHSTFYRQYFAEHGRAPSKAAYTTEAQRQLESGKGAMLDPGISQAYHLAKDRQASLDALANKPSEVAKAAAAPTVKRSQLTGKALSVPNKDLAPAAAPPSLPLESPIRALAASEKQSRFANVTVQNSDKVEPLTKQLVYEKNVGYTPQATKAGQAAAAARYGSGDVHQAAAEVTNHLATQDRGKITRQDVFDAHQVADRLQQSTDIKDKALAADIYGQLSEHHTAAGQQIQAAAALAKQSPEGMLYSATKALQNKGIKVEGQTLDNVNKAIDDYKQATKDVPKNKDNLSRKQTDQQALAYQKFVDTVNKQIPRSKGAAALGIWRAGLLTGPETAAKVAISHGITAPLELASKPISAAVDAVTSLITGKRGYTFNPSDLKAGAKGYGKGVKAASTKLATGADVPGTGGFEKGIGKTSRETVYEKVPTRVHASIAKPNFSAEYEMSLQSQARAAAINQGLHGAERTNFINDYVAKPPKAALERAQTEAEHFTNQNKTLLGQGASGIQSVPYVGKILAPFTRIPGAIGTKGLVDWTPLGFGKAIGNIVDGIRHGSFDQRAFSQNIGRATTGSGVAVVGYELMNNNRMTLAAPNDPKEKALWIQEGKQPNSIYVGGKVTNNSDGTHTYSGGKWLSLNAFGPAGITLGLGGGYSAARSQGKDIPSSVVQAGAAGGKVLASQPYLKGIAGVANAVNDPSRYAQTFLDSTVGSIIPAASSQTARGTDAIQRAYVPTIAGTLKGEVPGLRESLPAQLDTFGQPASSGNNGNIPVLSGAAQTTNPFYPHSPRNQQDSVTQELQRLYTTGGSQNAPAFAAPQKGMTINGQKLTLNPQQMNQYVASSGPLIHSGVTNLLNNPDYQKLTDTQKTTQINDVINAARTAAKVQLFGDQPKTLSSTERAAILSPGKLGANISIAGLKLADGIQPQDKTLLQSVATMGSAEKTAYMNDPKNKYQYDLASFHNDVLNGKLDSVQQFAKQDGLAKQAITSTYTNQVNELYAMSRAKITDYLNQHQDQSGKLQQQLIALDNQLYNGGYSTSLKFKSGVTVSGNGSSGKIQKVVTPFGSTFSKLDSLLRTTEHQFRAPRLGRSNVSLKGGKVPTPKAFRVPNAPSFLKVAKGTPSKKGIKLSV